MSYFRRWRRSSSGDASDDPPDHELVRRMRRADESALEELYKRYGGLIYTLVLRIVGDGELAREVLQDTFLRCWNGRESYDAGRGRVAWWLIGIARNRAIDVLRSRIHQGRLREERLTTSLHVPVETPDTLPWRLAIVRALDGLSAVQRRTIELAYYGGLTQAEVARELNEPLGTVKSRTREALDRLRQLLGPVIEPQEKDIRD